MVTPKSASIGFSDRKENPQEQTDLEISRRAWQKCQLVELCVTKPIPIMSLSCRFDAENSCILFDISWPWPIFGVANGLWHNHLEWNLFITRAKMVDVGRNIGYPPIPIYKHQKSPLKVLTVHLILELLCLQVGSWDCCRIHLCLQRFCRHGNSTWFNWEIGAFLTEWNMTMFFMRFWWILHVETCQSSSNFVVHPCAFVVFAYLMWHRQNCHDSVRKIEQMEIQMQMQ